MNMELLFFLPCPFSKGWRFNLYPLQNAHVPYQLVREKLVLNVGTALCFAHVYGFNRKISHIVYSDHLVNSYS